jgi:hypothetical protein
MPFDLGNPIFEVALGLAFVFFLFSLLISSATEGIAAVFQVRERKLAKGVERMIGDKVLSDAVMEHPLVRPDTTSTSWRKPAYVSPRNFSLALTQILRAKGTGAGPIEKVSNAVEAAATAEPAKKQLRGLLEEAEGELTGFRKGVEHWFDDGMDRVSGWYRSWSQLVTCLLALVVAVGLNVDTIRIAERLGENTALRTTVVEQAQATAEKEAARPGEPKTPTEAGEHVASAFDEVKALNLPILWGEGNDTVNPTTVVGWLITFLALSLGAPFWFSALSKIAHIKTTGKEPAPAK